jgi:hypothetical protein
MAKSFHTILVERTLEVDHKGETVILDLPSWLSDAKEVLMDKDGLVSWAQENEIIHGLLHAGIQKTLIDLRAKARPSTNTKTGESKSILDDRRQAQERIEEFVVRPVPVPGQGKTKAFGKGEESALKAAIEALKMAGMDDGKIVDILGEKFDARKVQQVIAGLIGAKMEDDARKEAIRQEESRHDR